MLGLSPDVCHLHIGMSFYVVAVSGAVLIGKSIISLTQLTSPPRVVDQTGLVSLGNQPWLVRMYVSRYQSTIC